MVIEQQLHVRKPCRQFGRVAIGKGYLAEWVILRGRWYDVGKFYSYSKRRLTGYYCDIIRPVTRLLSDTTKTSIITDLFLDLWITPEGRYVVLDEDKLERALANDVISTSLARCAGGELQSLIQSTQAGRFPPTSARKIQPLSIACDTRKAAESRCFFDRRS